MWIAIVAFCTQVWKSSLHCIFDWMFFEDGFNRSLIKSSKMHSNYSDCALISYSCAVIASDHLTASRLRIFSNISDFTLGISTSLCLFITLDGSEREKKLEWKKRSFISFFPSRHMFSSLSQNKEMVCFQRGLNTARASLRLIKKKRKICRAHPTRNKRKCHQQCLNDSSIPLLAEYDRYLFEGVIGSRCWWKPRFEWSSKAICP